MALIDFTKGKWKVIDTPTPINECVDHMITIAESGSTVKVTCGGNPVHSWPDGTYCAGDDSIYIGDTKYIWWVPNPTRRIQCKVGIGPLSGVTGSWTADDSGRKPGKHDKH
jgi:hypothetical protein